MKRGVFVIILFSVVQAQSLRLGLFELQTSVKDQGNLDYCAYYSVMALVESSLKQLTQKDYDLSEHYEFIRNKKIYPWRPEVEFGDTYRVLQNIVKDSYVISEDQKTRINFSGLEFKELSQLWIKKSWSEKVIEQLDQKHAVVVTLKVSPSYINDQTGVVQFDQHIDQECQSGKILCNGHAVLIVGYDSDAKLFYIKNSWGIKWGKNGYGTVRFSHVDSFASDFLTAFFNKQYSPSVKEVPL